MGDARLETTAAPESGNAILRPPFAPKRATESGHLVRGVPPSSPGDSEATMAELNRLRELEAMQQEIFAMVSHELRTPLNAIIGFSEAALRGIRGPLPEAYRGYFRDIGAVGRHLASVVDTLLDLARIEAGVTSFPLSPVAASALVADARAMVAPRAEQQGVDVTGVVAAGDWRVLAEPTRARQILVNLLANAVAFTPHGGRVGTETNLADDRLDLVVWDTGIGIPASEQGRIFNAFYQIGGGSNAVRGAGLGLAIARQLARAMGGDITVRSEPGCGSRFTLRLPLAPA